MEWHEGEVTVSGVVVGRPDSITYTGLTKIREDVTMVTVYPNLEPADADEDNPGLMIPTHF